MPHVQGQRNPSKTVGGAHLHLESNPIPTRDTQTAQANLMCTRTQGPHSDWGRTVFERLLWRCVSAVDCHGDRGPGCSRLGYGISPLRVSLVAQLVKNPLTMEETWVWSWVGKTPWRRKSLPTPVFWPGEYSPWRHKVLDTTEQLSRHSRSRSPLSPPYSCQTLHRTRKKTLGGHKHNLVCTRTQEKGAVTPQETGPDLIVSVQESPLEVWLAVACCRVGGTEFSSECVGPFERGHHCLHYLHHSLAPDK